MTTTIYSKTPTQSAIQVNGVDKVLINESGSIDLLGGKIIGAAPSTVQLATTNGFGSTNTQVRRWTTVTKTQGTDITYADSATLGGSFTINTTGIYAISLTDQTVAANNGIAVTVNAITFSSVSAAMPLVVSSVAANFSTGVSGTLSLIAGDVVRAVCTAASGGAPAQTGFIITKVG